MARNRTISPDFWTWEAVIDCAAMTRFLFIGLWNFADDGGVQPLRPRTIRMQVFPGDDIGNDAVRAMIEELAMRKLVRIYEVDGVEYVSIVDWEQIQRVGKHARRRYPAFPSPRDGQEPQMEAHEELPTAASASDHGKPWQSASSGLRPSSSSGPPGAADAGGEKEDQFIDPAPLSQAA
ncbi:MAG: hypothetical protein AB7O88_25155 [Reyranellaceae bacterium]